MNKNLIERLNSTQLKELQLISSMIAKGESSDTLKASWNNFLKNSKEDIEIPKNGEAKLDIHELMQYVLTRSYEEMSEDLKYHTKKVKYFNELREQIRENISKLRKTKHDYISSQEEILSTIANDDQAANIDLQNMLQKQTQTMQTISNVSKMLQDTAKAVIRNIR